MGNIIKFQEVVSRRTEKSLQESHNRTRFYMVFTNALVGLSGLLVLAGFYFIGLKRFVSPISQISKIILNNYTLSIKSPWVLFKTTSHFVKAFNATGGKIPYIQWYKKKDNYQSIYEMQEVNEFHRRICGKSNVVKEFISDFGKLNNIQLKRLFNIALLEKRLQLGEDKLRQYLLEEMNIVERIGT